MMAHACCRYRGQDPPTDPDQQVCRLVCLLQFLEVVLQLFCMRSSAACSTGDASFNPVCNKTSSLLPLVAAPPQLIMDVSTRQKLRLHAPKLLWWAFFEFFVIATTVMRVRRHARAQGWGARCHSQLLHCVPIQRFLRALPYRASHSMAHGSTSRSL